MTWMLMALAAEASKMEGFDLVKVVAANLHEVLADATEGAASYTDYLCTIP